MREQKGGVSTDVGTFARLSAAIMAVVAIILIPIGAAGATPDTTNPEDYPPDAITNLIDPFGCAPTGISGVIGAVQPGSTLTGTLTISGTQVSQATATVPANGVVRYSVAVPPNTFGPAVVKASGTNTVGQPFTLETTATIAACPALPQTGSSNSGRWITLGVAAVLVGGFLVVVSTRRRRETTGA